MEKDNGSTRQSREGASWRVLDDFPKIIPVTPDELDVVEAFLLAELHAIISGETTAVAGLSQSQDSEPPQTHAEIKASAKGRKYRSRGTRR